LKDKGKEGKGVKRRCGSEKAPGCQKQVEKREPRSRRTDWLKQGGGKQTKKRSPMNKEGRGKKRVESRKIAKNRRKSGGAGGNIRKTKESTQKNNWGEEKKKLRHGEENRQQMQSERHREKGERNSRGRTVRS